MRLVYWMRRLFHYRKRNPKRPTEFIGKKEGQKITFKTISKPACGDFLKIKKDEEAFQTIDEYARQHSDLSEDALKSSIIQYRGREILFDEWIEEYSNFVNSMAFVKFIKPFLIIDPFIKAAAYYTKKAGECLQFARFFIMKSGLLLETNANIKWTSGYVPQFYFRCIYFGTAATWLSNSFDHVLQSIYWGFNLFTNVIDRNGQPYNSSWDSKRIMENCSYEFVVGELKTRGFRDCRRHLTTCSSKIEEVRKWANYIKHKGGIDYKYLEADAPMDVYYAPLGDASKEGFTKAFPHNLDDRFKISDFKSPVELDIDIEIKKLFDAHQAIYTCINETITDIDYEKHKIQL